MFVVHIYDPERNRDFPEVIVEFETIEECFSYFHKQNMVLKEAHFASETDSNTLILSKNIDHNIVYESMRNCLNDAEALHLQRLTAQNTPFIYILQKDTPDNLSFEELIKRYNSWSNWNIIRKIFHPGNSLTMAVILTAVGIGLVGFGIACPPVLVFVALGFAAFSAISTIGYAIDWFKRDWSVYKAKTEATLQKASLRDYLENCWNRLKQWIPNHKPQAIMMGIGTVVFLGALAVLAGHFIAIAVTGAGFAFMTMGASGGALGLTSSFFAAGFGAINGLAASAAAVLTSVFAAMALVLGPTNILDSIRRLASGVYKRFFGEESISNQPDEEMILEKIILREAFQDDENSNIGEDNLNEYSNILEKDKTKSKIESGAAVYKPTTLVFHYNNSDNED